jgi:single-strand DNA-binding protein
MASVNKVIIVGNLGRDPETRHAPSGDAVCSLAVATTSKWKDQASGKPMEHTEWHRVVGFGRVAEIMSEYLKKGSPVYIEGKLKTRKYTDKEGVEKYATEVIADNLQLLGGRPTDAEPAAPSRPAPVRETTDSIHRPVAKKPAANFADMDDDIPF